MQKQEAEKIICPRCGHDKIILIYKDDYSDHRTYLCDRCYFSWWSERHQELLKRYEKRRKEWLKKSAGQF